MNHIRINEYFNVSEFVCPCCGAVKIDEHGIECLTQLRRERGRLIITPDGGGYRCPAYQHAIKFARTEMGRVQPKPKISAHPMGKGWDVTVFGVDSGNRIPLTNEDVPYLQSLGFNGIGIGLTGWAHLDIAHTDKLEVWGYAW